MQVLNQNIAFPDSTLEFLQGLAGVSQLFACGQCSGELLRQQLLLLLCFPQFCLEFRFPTLPFRRLNGGCR
ncbi:MAG: hypothetical protein ACKON9_23335, partial [Planctomycetaceae bacterium]